MDGSSQWVVGRNVTRKYIIDHMDYNRILFRIPDTCVMNTITLTDVSDHSFIPASLFCQSGESSTSPPVVSLMCAVHSSKLTWQDTKKVIDKVHKHVCGHCRRLG